MANHLTLEERKMDDREIHEAVRSGWAQEWAPEPIAGGRRPHASDRRVSWQTIDTWIQQDEDRAHGESLLRLV